jgi:hypothetical protein
MISLEEHIKALFQAERTYADTRFSSVEKAMEDHDKSIRNIMEIFDERLGRFNAFRDQISAERSLYVTRDQLDVTSKGIMDQIDILKRAITLTAGKDTGVSKVWGTIVIGFSIMAAIGTISTAIGVFFKNH